ncbi:MAG: hypothetical protein QNL42_00270 [Flavobacteriaceae bacterium]
MNLAARHLYQEKQRFTKWWMWLIILLPLEIALNAFYLHFSLGISLGNKPLTDGGIIAFLLFGIAFAYFFRINELRTTLTEEGIRVHFYPYTSQNVSWGEVEHCEVIPYDFVGGWGVRLWTQYGTVYNVQGGKGLYVQLKNKKKFLVGTQKPEELQLLVQQLQHSALDVVAE